MKNARRFDFPSRHLLTANRSTPPKSVTAHRLPWNAPSILGNNASDVLPTLRGHGVRPGIGADLRHTPARDFVLQWAALDDSASMLLSLIHG